MARNTLLDTVTIEENKITVNYNQQLLSKDLLLKIESDYNFIGDKFGWCNAYHLYSKVCVELEKNFNRCEGSTREFYFTWLDKFKRLIYENKEKQDDGCILQKGCEG